MLDALLQVIVMWPVRQYMLQCVEQMVKPTATSVKCSFILAKVDPQSQCSRMVYVVSIKDFDHID